MPHFFRNLLFFIFGVVIFPGLGFSEVAADGPEWYNVKKAVSGNSLELDSGAVVAYASVIAPDLMSQSKSIENYAKESLQFNQNLAEEKEIRLEWGGRVRHPNGDYMAYVFLKDGTFLNLEVLEQGYGKLGIEAPNFEYSDDLQKAAMSARREQKGLWKYERDRPNREARFIGNTMKKEYHHPDCPELSNVAKAHQRTFLSSVDAKSASYRVCKVCKKIVRQNTTLF